MRTLIFSLVFTILFPIAGMSNTHGDLLSRINSCETELLVLENETSSPVRTAQIEFLKNEIYVAKIILSQEHYASPSVILTNVAVASGDIELISLVFYDWSASDYRVVAKVRNSSFIYAEWVKIYFYFYFKGNLVGDDFTYIDYNSYGDAGLLPYHDSFSESYIDKFQFDDVKVDIRYDRTNGDDVFLCDQILQLEKVFVEPITGYAEWLGTVNNMSTHSIESPKIYANILRSDSLIDIDHTLLDTECQGERAVIIDYVIDAPVEAQEIMLRNCLYQNVNISGWYLGHKASPYAYQVPNNTILQARGEKSFDHSDLNFTIGTENEIISLSNADKNLIDQWTKDENENILQPLTSCCFDDHLNKPKFYDKIKYKLNYSLRTLAGSGNLTPNHPKFTLALYTLAPHTNHNFQLFLLDPNDDAVEFQIDWDRGERTGWLGPYNSRTVASVAHSFSEYGDYWVSARSRDKSGAVSTWSDSVRVFVDWTVPVELTSFTARLENHQVLLTWQTESETNNLGFSVERLTDDKTWQEIGFVPGFGTTSARQFYSFTDIDVTGPKRFYRLKQVDQDGSFHYSEIVSIETTSSIHFKIVSIVPNPFNAATLINYQVAEKSMVRIDVFDIHGRHVQTLKNEIVDAGEQTVIWEPNGQPSGAYLVRIENAGLIKMKKCLLLK